jgi:hypothetical protein
MHDAGRRKVFRMQFRPRLLFLKELRMKIKSLVNPASCRGAFALSVLASTLLAGCGGGGGGASVAGPTSLSGTVAVGAPMLNGTVTVKGANGVSSTASAGADGSYSGLSLDGLTAPYRVQACGLVDGNYTCYYSVVNAAGTANVTPLTHASVSLALGEDAAAMFETGGVAPDTAALDAKKLLLKEKLGPILSGLGLDIGNLDFATSAFTANRTGMDKLLDAVKITTGSDFVQVEGHIGSGNVYLGTDGSTSGALSGGAGLSVDLQGISNVFASMSSAIGAASESLCAEQMTAAGIFDAAFSLTIDGGSAITASTASEAICHIANLGGLLGGVIASPVLGDCDFAGADKTCSVGFDIVKGDVVFEGAELAVVLRSGAATWKLLGQDSPYEIHVNAAAQRTLRVDIDSPTPEYYRALSFDVGNGGGTVHVARVYQRDEAGTGWDSSPLVVLDRGDSACVSSGTPRLTIQGGSCGSSWLSLQGNGASGDALIDAFYKRGRQVKIDLYSDDAGTALVTSVIKRVEGVPPKLAALASVPWLELDAATKAALVSYDGFSPNFTASWLPSRAVGGKDITFCLSGDCSGSNRAAHDDVSNARSGVSSKTLTLSSVPSGASAYKQIALFGRDREQMGIQTNYVSCGGPSVSVCPP